MVSMMKNNLINLSKQVLLTLGLTTICSNAPARALTLTSSDVNNSFDIKWVLEAGESDNDGGATSSIDLSAKASFTLTNFDVDFNGDEDRIRLEVEFQNNTTLSSTVTEAGITTFGFGINPNADSVIIGNLIGNNGDSDSFSNAIVQTKNTNFPGGFKNIDVCVFTDNNCKGGGQGTALAAGSTDNFFLEIFGDFSDSVELTPFAIKYQTTEDSFEFAGNEKTEIPEPGMIVALSLFAFSFLIGLQKQKN